MSLEIHKKPLLARDLCEEAYSLGGHVITSKEPSLRVESRCGWENKDTLGV